VEIEPDGNSFHLTFEKRKNAQCMQENRVGEAATTIGLVCPFKMLEMMRLHTGESEDAFVFRGFTGRLVKPIKHVSGEGKYYICTVFFLPSAMIWGRDGDLPHGVPLSSSTAHKLTASEEH
jgi:hypothetical protein